MNSLLTYYFIKKGLLLPAFLGVLLFSWLNPFGSKHQDGKTANMVEKMDLGSLMQDVHALMRQNKQQEAFRLAELNPNKNSSEPVKEFVRAFGVLQSSDSLLRALHQDILAAILSNRYSGVISSDTLMNRLIIQSIRNNRGAALAAISEKKMEKERKEMAEDKQRVAEELEMLNEANMYVRIIYSNH